MQKRNNKHNLLTLSKKAQDKLDKVAKGKKSAYVSAAIEWFEPVVKEKQ